MSYDFKYDGLSLTEASCKKYLEELLVSVRHALERRRERTASTSSNASVSSMPPLETSTPVRPRLNSIDEDMRYIERD
jgi:hypothetical protein